MPPPTRAKSAMLLAPIENPVTTGKIVPLTTPASQPNFAVIPHSASDSPVSPSPTTHIPITLPPENATCSASGSPFRAAFVVRMLDAVATFIPKNPDIPEHSAPNTNATATSLIAPVLMTASNAATSTTTTASTLYSRFRNAIAPSRTLPPISCIRSVPGSCLWIQLVFQAANASASTPLPKAAYKNFSMVSSIWFYLPIVVSV